MELKKPNIGVVYEDDTERQTWAVRRDTRMHQERRNDLRHAVRATFYAVIAIMIHIDIWQSDNDPATFDGGEWAAAAFIALLVVFFWSMALSTAAQIGKKLNG